MHEFYRDPTEVISIYETKEASSDHQYTSPEGQLRGLAVGYSLGNTLLVDLYIDDKAKEGVDHLLLENMEDTVRQSEDLNCIETLVDNPSTADYFKKFSPEFIKFKAFNDRTRKLEPTRLSLEGLSDCLSKLKSPYSASENEDRFEEPFYIEEQFYISAIISE